MQLNQPNRDVSSDHREKPRAFSYLRFSDSKQMKGDSLRRQIERSKEYAEKHGLLLDETTTIKDLGVSAFRGANREMGALADFLTMVREGRIPKGSFLLVESLDRLSRDKVTKAIRPFLDIIDAGINIVTLADGHLYNTETVADGMQLMFSLIIMTRAHEESRMKADRLSKAWAGKREQAQEKKLSAKCPHWLKLSPDRTRFELIPDRVAVVNRIMTETVNGVGRATIAKRLNADGIKPWGSGKAGIWHDGTVQKVVENKAVIGWFQPHTVTREYVTGPDGKPMLREKRTPVGPPIKDYFPKIISDELWLQVQATAKKRSMKPGNLGGRKGTVFSNLFTGLARCSECGLPMNYRDRGPRSTVVLRCSGERNGTCDNKGRIPYHPLEESLIRWVCGMEIIFGSETVSHEEERIRQALSEKTVIRQQYEEEGAELLKEFGFRPGKLVTERIRLLETEIEKLDTEIRNLEKELSVFEGAVAPNERVQDIERLHKEMLKFEGPDRYLYRARIAENLKDLFERIECHPSGKVEVISKRSGARYNIRYIPEIHDGGVVFDFPSNRERLRLARRLLRTKSTTTDPEHRREEREALKREVAELMKLVESGK